MEPAAAVTPTPIMMPTMAERAGALRDICRFIAPGATPEYNGRMGASASLNSVYGLYAMLEKRKEESESVGKYQTMLMGAIIGAFLVWAMPYLIAYIFGVDNIFEPPAGADLPKDLTEKIDSLYQSLLWVVRIVFVFAIMVSVVLLRLDRAR